MIAGFKMLDMLGSEDAQRIVAELNLGSENAIKTMDSGTARFVARFLKDNAVDIVLLAAACATGGTALAPAISRLSTTLGVAGNIQQIQDKYRQLKREGATEEEIIASLAREVALIKVNGFTTSIVGGGMQRVVEPVAGTRGAKLMGDLGVKVGASYPEHRKKEDLNNTNNK